jgi:hypothetical protein
MHSAIDHVKVGNQVLITSVIESYIQEDSTFAAVIEVRDSDGFTRSINWQTGLLSQNEKTEIGISWIPDMADTYEIHVFVLSSLINPTAYTPIMTGHVIVTEN